MAVGDPAPEPRVGASVKQGWQNTWHAFWPLLGFTLIVAVVQSVAQVGRIPMPWQAVLVVGTLGLAVGFLLGGPLAVGMTRSHLVASFGGRPTFEDFGSGFKRYWEAVGLAALSWIIIFVGFILLILPGIYLATRLQFATYRFIVDGLGPVEALKASMEDTKGRFWSAFGLGLMLFLLIIAGLMALVVGVFVAMVLVGQVQAAYWRAVYAERQGVDLPPPASTLSPS